MYNRSMIGSSIQMLSQDINPWQSSVKHKMVYRIIVHIIFTLEPSIDGPCHVPKSKWISFFHGASCSRFFGNFLSLLHFFYGELLHSPCLVHEPTWSMFCLVHQPAELDNWQQKYDGLSMLHWCFWMRLVGLLKISSSCLSLSPTLCLKTRKTRSFTTQSS